MKARSADHDRDPLAVFGARLRQARKARGVSQADLARRAGLDRTYVGGVERGERNLGLINLIRLLRALEIEPGKLFEEAGTRRE